MGLTLDRLREHLGKFVGLRSSELLDSLLQMFADELDAAQVNCVNGAAQIYPTRASGEYLDLWGVSFGVARKAGEADAAYADRIIAETVQLRSTNLALEDIVQKAYGYTAHVRDLWPFVAHTDMWESPVGHPIHVTDAHLDPAYDTWEDMGVRTPGDPYWPEVFAVWIDVPTAEYPIDPTPIMELIERHRAAGTKAVLMAQIAV